MKKCKTKPCKTEVNYAATEHCPECQEDREKLYGIRTTRLTVLHPRENLLSENITEVEIGDEFGSESEFVIVKQDNDDGVVRILPSEWPNIREAINLMVDDIVKTAEARCE